MSLGYIGRIFFCPTTHMIFVRGSVTPVSSIVSPESEITIVKCFDTWACKIHNSKVGSVPATFAADSRRTYCKVCNDAII